MNEDTVKQRRERRSKSKASQNRSERVNNQREVKRLLGICIFCSEKALPNRKLCERHANFYREQHAKKRSNGKCLVCSMPTNNQFSKCESCHKKYTEKQQLLVKDREEKGLCRMCGILPRKENRAACNKCLEKSKVYQNNKKTERLAAGLCIGCRVANANTIPNQKLCLECYMKILSHDNLGSRADWPLLLEKFNSCGGKCAYSGLQLTLGTDASLDHIIPVSKGGAFADINNLQWVHRTVNSLKRDLLEEELLKWISLIYNHRFKK